MHPCTPLTLWRFANRSDVAEARAPRRTSANKHLRAPSHARRQLCESVGCVWLIRAPLRAPIPRNPE